MRSPVPHVPNAVSALTRFDEFLRRIVLERASDLHLACQRPPSWRLHGRIEAMSEDPWHGETMLELLDALGCRYRRGQAGLFVWAELPEGYEGDSFAFSDEVMEKTDVFLTPGGIFGSEGNGYIRITLCCPEALLKKAEEAMNPQPPVDPAALAAAQSQQLDHARMLLPANGLKGSCDGIADLGNVKFCDASVSFCYPVHSWSSCSLCAIV